MPQKFKTTLIPSFLFILIILVLSIHYRTESSDHRLKSISLAGEHHTIQKVIHRAQISPGKALLTLKNNGLNTVLFTPSSIHDLIKTGILSIHFHSQKEMTTYKTSPQYVDLMEIIYKVLKNKHGNIIQQSKKNEIDLFSLTHPDIEHTIIGFLPQTVLSYKKEGFHTIGVLCMCVDDNAETIPFKLQQAKEAGVDAIMLDKNSAAISSSAIDALIQQISDLRLTYILSEHSRLSMDSHIIEALLKHDHTCHQILKIHQVTDREASTIPIQKLIERYMRAASERSANILEISHPFFHTIDFSNLESSYLNQLKSKLGIKGFHIEKSNLMLPTSSISNLFQMLPIPESIFSLLMLTLLCLCLWKIYSFFLQTSSNFICLYLSLILASVIFGMINYFYYLSPLYYLQIKSVPYVKLSYLVPPFFLFFILNKKRWNLSSLWNKPVLFGHTIILFSITILLLLLLIRSGNQSILPISTIEFHLRSFLENTLPARPRLKEIFFSYPFLIIGLWTYIQSDKIKRFDWLQFPSVIMISLGGFTLSSIYNTLSHIHTPLDVHIARIISGFIFGSITGSIMLAILNYYFHYIVKYSLRKYE